MLMSSKPGRKRRIGRAIPRLRRRSRQGFVFVRALVRGAHFGAGYKATIEVFTKAGSFQAVMSQLCKMAGVKRTKPDLISKLERISWQQYLIGKARVRWRRAHSPRWQYHKRIRRRRILNLQQLKQRFHNRR